MIASVSPAISETRCLDVKGQAGSYALRSASCDGCTRQAASRRQSTSTSAAFSTRRVRSAAAAAGLSSRRASCASHASFYSAGLAIPFLLTALAFRKMTNAFAVLKRHYRAIMAAGGAVLIVMGVLIWTGELFQLNIEAQRFLDRFGLNFFSDV